jgi:hypothetical protein
VNKQGSALVTRRFTGAFEDPAARREVLEALEASGRSL